MSKAAEKFLSEQKREFKDSVLSFDKNGFWMGTGLGLIVSALVIWINPEQVDDFIFVCLLLGVFLTTIGLFLHKKGNSGDEA
jgi:hypothetical protein